MVGDMDNTGSLNAQFIHQLTTHVRSKVALQVSTAHRRNASADTNTLILQYNIYTWSFITSLIIKRCQWDFHIYKYWKAQCPLKD